VDHKINRLYVGRDQGIANVEPHVGVARGLKD
jgi:hypothetical protein